MMLLPRIKPTACCQKTAVRIDPVAEFARIRTVWKRNRTLGSSATPTERANGTAARSDDSHISGGRLQIDARSLLKKK
jgi:hypothetical protein